MLQTPLLRGAARARQAWPRARPPSSAASKGTAASTRGFARLRRPGRCWVREALPCQPRLGRVRARRVTRRRHRRLPGLRRAAASEVQRLLGADLLPAPEGVRVGLNYRNRSPHGELLKSPRKNPPWIRFAAPEPWFINLCQQPPINALDTLRLTTQGWRQPYWSLSGRQLHLTLWFQFRLWLFGALALSDDVIISITS